MNEDLKFYQACYTRLDGNTSASGWKLCNLSSDMRAEMQSFFESSEKVNEIIDAPICLMKIFGNGTYTGISRIQYGTKDNFGRPKFFSHGFVFEDAYEFLKDPNGILTVAPENFHFTLEETANAPANLHRTAKWTEMSALARCGMNKDSYIKYIECVYAALFARTKMTIYVKTDGTDEMMSALLYLTYSALPYSLRPRITASDSEKNAKNMMLVFTSEVPAGYKYVEPQTGNNNVVDRAHERRLEENEFALYYVKNSPQSPENVKAYYELIEKYLDHMGDERQSEISALRLAFNMMTRKRNRSNEELIGLLYDWLNLDVPTNDHIIANYCEVLNMISERCKNGVGVEDGFEIPSEIEATLVERLHQVASPNLEETYLNYVLALFEEYHGKDAKCFAILGKQQEDEKIFPKLCAKMKDNSAFEILLRKYYHKLANELDAKVYPDISNFYANAQYQDQHMREILLQKCEDIALNDIKKGIEFEQLKGNYIRTAGSIGVTGCSIKKLCDEFHKMFMQSVTFDPKRMKEYRDFYKNYPNYPQANQILNAIDLYREKIKNPTEDEEHRAFADYMKANKVTIPTAQISVIMKYLIHKEANKLCRSVHLWFSLAEATGKNVFAFAVENEIALLTDADVMKSSMMTNNVWKEKIFLTLLESFDEYEKLNKNKLSSEMKKVKGALRDEYDRQKQAIEAEKKRLAKEKAEQEKLAAKIKAEEEANAKALEKKQKKEAEKREKEAAKIAKKQGKNPNFDEMNMDEPPHPTPGSNPTSVYPGSSQVTNVQPTQRISMQPGYSQQPTGYQQQPTGHQQQPTGYQQPPMGHQQPPRTPSGMPGSNPPYITPQQVKNDHKKDRVKRKELKHQDPENNPNHQFGVSEVDVDKLAKQRRNKNQNSFDDAFLKDNGNEVGLTSNNQSSDVKIYSNKDASEREVLFDPFISSSSKSKKWGRK